MKRYTAELVGTFVLVFGGCGAAVFAGGKIGFAGVAFAFELSLLAMVYAIGPVSGCLSFECSLNGWLGITYLLLGIGLSIALLGLDLKKVWPLNIAPTIPDPPA